MGNEMADLVVDYFKNMGIVNESIFLFVSSCILAFILITRRRRYVRLIMYVWAVLLVFWGEDARNYASLEEIVGLNVITGSMVVGSVIVVILTVQFIVREARSSRRV